MAGYYGAIARIRYLAGITESRHSTPRTISGTGNHIFSYGKLIAWRDPDTNVWTVTDDKSTATTNRHISAAREALT